MTTAVTRSDAEIQRDVLAELDWEARVQPNEVGVSVRDGVVILTGWVDNYAKKWAAERAVQRLRGVRAVANDIEVRLPGEAERLDPDVALAAIRALEWDSFVPIENLDLTVSNGWVMLRGVVEWGYQKRAAEQAVRRLAGVRGVTNLVTVQPDNRPSARDLERDIRNALVRSMESAAEGIGVAVEGDRVVLTGTARSWLERAEAERVAWSARGVAGVDDRISVLA
ncbi:BON domain-containing protein [Plantactinospora sp. GCM10030261]|uniref:BON domain-containing protein n=1 Tax=Plantactinospora sp. GCM10030261 TaxID=3273420 RepID=UPI00360C13C7